MRLAPREFVAKPPIHIQFSSVHFELLPTLSGFSPGKYATCSLLGCVGASSATVTFAP